MLFVGRHLEVRQALQCGARSAMEDWLVVLCQLVQYLFQAAKGKVSKLEPPAARSSDLQRGPPIL